MDLVPILTTIILVGTMATLMLVIFIYSLYKVRGRRTIQGSPKPKYLVSRRRKRTKLRDAGGAPRAPLGQPTEASMYVPPTPAPLPQELGGEGEGTTQESSAADDSPPAQGFGKTSSRFSAGNDALFLEYTGEGFVPVDPSASASRPSARTRSKADNENDGLAWL